ncbi:hypothetical protein BH23GEM7_BH23GEM7_08660 [soil metagenome]
MWVLCLLPLALLVWDAFTDGLGAEPIEAITHRTGWWGLTLLLVTLAVTPVRRLTRWNRVIQLRRPLGLFAFFYVCLHFLWLVKADVREPLLFGAALAVLLAFRLPLLRNRSR